MFIVTSNKTKKHRGDAWGCVEMRRKIRRLEDEGREEGDKDVVKLRGCKRWWFWTIELKGKVKDVYMWRRWEKIRVPEDKEKEKGDKDAV